MTVQDKEELVTKEEINDDQSVNLQVFKVDQSRCHVLSVTIIRGRGITRGRLKDWLYSPDPYVTVRLLGTPNPIKKTKHVSKTCDPEWNETFQFYMDPKKDRVIEFVLYDLNRTVNEEIGREIFDYNRFPENQDNSIVISYKNGSKIEVKMRHGVNSNPTTRFGLELCPEEKNYLEKRKVKVLEGLSTFLDHDKPKNSSECPNVCLMTSGGGFRAMIAYGGAYKAMEDSGLIDCVTYTSALSGSSWYLATLYSHPDYTREPHVSHKILPEIRSCVEKHWQVHLSPPWSSTYLRKIIAKSLNGQPVSFTDFYGYLVGQQLLKGRMKARLSDQADIIANGQVPMPMYTCLHVKSNVSAKVFQEWYEFTPYEVGIPKYGLFFKTSDFASKFYMGEKIKSFPEVRLHYLYGIWGSAFTILFKRLHQERSRNGQKEIVKMILQTPSSNNKEEETLIERCLNNCDDEENINNPEFPEVAIEDLTSDNDESLIEICDDDDRQSEINLLHGKPPENDDETIAQDRTTATVDDNEEKRKRKSIFRRYSLPKFNRRQKSESLLIPTSETVPNLMEEANNENFILNKNETKEDEETSRWNQFLVKALTTSPIDSRAFRAGVIYNPLRGLTLNEMNNNLKDVNNKEDTDFRDFKESTKTHTKRIYLVDSGLSFNLPFPLTLRPQRGIELYITCDFSSRASDSTPPFRELLLSEKWANLHQIPFPPIREIAKQYLDSPVEECYVFKDPHDATIPVIIFFPLVNKDFRKYKSPGILRETEAELNFANFDIFDNTNAYAIWRFVYPNQSFDRMTAMMEFNILNNLHIIKSEMAEIVRRKK